MRIIDLFEDRFFTVSNLLSLTRVILAPFVYYLIVLQGEADASSSLVMIIGFMGVMFITDFLDGFLARKFNQVTRLGQYLDPVADKFASYTVIHALVVYRDFPAAIFIFGVVRELLVVFAAFYLFRRRDIDTRPNLTGKVTVFIMAIAALMYVGNCQWQIAGFPMKEFFAYLLVPLYIAGAIAYIRSYAGYWFAGSED